MPRSCVIIYFCIWDFSIQIDATFLFISPLFWPPPPLSPVCRLAKAIANLQCFSLAVDPSFRHFHLEASKEVDLIQRVEFIRRKLSFYFPTRNSSGTRIPDDWDSGFSPLAAPLAPVIDTQKTLAYDQLFLCWRLPQDSAQAWHFSVEYQRQVGCGAATWGGIRSSNSATAWQHLDEVRGTSAVVDRLQINSVYVLRVRGCNKAGYGEYSEEVYLHTPPAPGMNTHTHTDTEWSYTHTHTSRVWNDVKATNEVS